MAARIVASNEALRGNKRPYPHRFHLVDGRVIEGDLYRGVNSRLSDDLYGMKGAFLAILNARCTTDGTSAAFLAVNLDHIVTIEEL